MLKVADGDAGIYEFERLIGVAGRENNPRRRFLLINRLQGKYAPAVPRESIRMFHALGQRAAALTQGQETVVIGFAETATALGAFAAEAFGENTYYLHTTRRPTDGPAELAAFEEEHSHATSHKLFCGGPAALARGRWVVLMDDEFTTGKTVCNLVDSLRRSGALARDVRFLAASVLNGMSNADLRTFSDQGIECVWLVRRENLAEIAVEAGEKADSSTGTASAQAMPGGARELPRPGCGGLREISEAGRPELFSGIFIGEYRRACEEFAARVLGQTVRPGDTGRMLVLGTEEFMYPAILFGALLQDFAQGASVRVQATGRSPIVVSGRPGYPIYNRERFASVYDAGREVYLYNIEKYHRVFLLTDAPEAAEASAQTLAALQKFGNEQIVLVRWGG